MAKSIAGKFASDILHDSLIAVQEKQIKDFDSYLFMTMRNKYLDFLKKEKKNSSIVEIEHFETSTPSIHYLNQILLTLETQGYSNEVSIFKESYFVSNMVKVAERRGKSYDYIRRKCNFVKEQIKKNYHE